MHNRTAYLKNAPLKNLFFSLKLAFAGMLLLTACRQEPDAPAADAAAEVDVEKVTALEALGHKFGFTEAEYQQYVHGKHELNAKELDLFNELEAKWCLAHPALQESEKEGVLRMLEIKKELNRRTLKAFNKPYNQVEGTKVVPIMDALYGKSEVLAAGGRVAACPYVRKFPGGTGVGATLKQNCGNLADVQKEGDSDCDYQYSFSTAHYYNWPAVIGKTPKALELLKNSPYFPPYGECRGFGGSVSRRRSGDVLSGGDYSGEGYCILLGKGRVDKCYFNAPGILKTELAMGTY